MSSKLKWGYTTGTCAAAGVKAALLRLLYGGYIKKVSVSLPGNRHLDIDVADLQQNRDTAIATVIKDGGDDPDCTHGAEIKAKVSIGLTAPPAYERKSDIVFDCNRFASDRKVLIRGGEGVGIVTRPGLPIVQGEYAINPVPRKMILRAVEEAFLIDKHGLDTPRKISLKDYWVNIEIIVPEGKRLAKETLNPRLGILDGISILGTTGLVKPFSHGAYRATIYVALRAAIAQGVKKIFLTTGSTSDAVSRRLNNNAPEIAFCQMGDYVKFALYWAERLKFNCAHIYAFWGKTVKMAQGLGMTHASSGDVDIGLIADMLEALYPHTKGSILTKEIRMANTARHALSILKNTEFYPAITQAITQRAIKMLNRFFKKGLLLRLTLLDYDGNIICEKDDKEEHIDKITA